MKRWIVKYVAEIFWYPEILRISLKLMNADVGKHISLVNFIKVCLLIKDFESKTFRLFDFYAIMWKWTKSSKDQRFEAGKANDCAIQNPWHDENFGRFSRDRDHSIQFDEIKKIPDYHILFGIRFPCTVLRNLAFFTGHVNKSFEYWTLLPAHPTSVSFVKKCNIYDEWPDMVVDFPIRIELMHQIYRFSSFGHESWMGSRPIFLEFESHTGHDHYLGGSERLNEFDSSYDVSIYLREAAIAGDQTLLSSDNMLYN